VPGVGGSLNLGLVNELDPFGNRIRLVTLGYSRQLFAGANFFVTGFAGFDSRRNAGVLAGISIPLDGGITASSGVSHDRSGLAVASDIDKPIGQEPGSFGWRLSDLEGNAMLRQASAAYRSDYGKIEATALQSQAGFAGTLSTEGAVVAAGGDVFFSNRIDDAFAIVDAGAPGVEVFHENRPTAITDANGKAIVPSLNSYQPNKISIDPKNLPLDASIATTQDVLVPADRSGVFADFGIKTGVHSAIVILTAPDGQPLQAGLRGTTASRQKFAVGYDGRAFIEGLAPQNSVTVALSRGECHAEFSYAPQSNGHTVIGPVVCQ
jgi:outer membrane usher protein